MKRLMILAAIMTAMACGDDSSSGDDNSDDSSNTDETPKKDAGKADAKVDARSSSTDDDNGDDDSDGTDDDDVSDDDPKVDAGKVDAGKADAGKTDAASGNECALLSYASFGRAFEMKYCASCHAASVEGDDRKDAPEDAVFDTLDQIKEAKALIKAFAVSSKAMPPPDDDGDKPTDAERVQFGKFLDCGPK